MILDDIADLITSLRKKHSVRKIAHIFERERKWVYAVENGCCIRLDTKFIAGLSSIGYELILVKKNRS